MAQQELTRGQQFVKWGIETKRFNSLKECADMLRTPNGKKYSYVHLSARFNKPEHEGGISHLMAQQILLEFPDAYMVIPDVFRAAMERKASDSQLDQLRVQLNELAI
jgi:hypothetical protein